MRVRHEKLFSGILQAAEMSIKDPFRNYRGKDLAEILSACAMLQIPVPESFVQVMQQDLLDPQKDYFVHNALENAALALGILGYLPMQLIDMILSSPKASTAKQPNRGKEKRLDIVDYKYFFMVEVYKISSLCSCGC